MDGNGEHDGLSHGASSACEGVPTGEQPKQATFRTMLGGVYVDVPQAESVLGDAVAPSLQQLILEERREAAAHARRLEAMHAIRIAFEDDFRAGAPAGQGMPDHVHAAAVAEIAALRGVGRGVVIAELDEASLLMEGLTGVFDAMLDGRVRRRHASAIIAEAEPVVTAEREAWTAYEQARENGAATESELADLRADAEAAGQRCGEYEERAIELAAELSPKALRARCGRLAASIAAIDLEQRQSRARERRGVRIHDAGDGMSELVACIPTVYATAIHERLTKQADAQSKVEGEERTFDQLRADLLTDVLLTGQPSGAHEAGQGIQATVSVTIPFFTLAGLDEEPALLEGVSPMSLAEAKRFASLAPTWLRVLTDPVTGVAREVDTYRPTAAMRALVTARDATCRFVGCTRPAGRGDVDHIEAHVDGGPTSLSNLEALCRHHHTLKHMSAWQVRHDAERYGDLIWTSPAGREYRASLPPTGPVFTRSDIDRMRTKRRRAGKGPGRGGGHEDRGAPPGTREPGSREAAARESGARETGGQESGAREPGARGKHPGQVTTSTGAGPPGNPATPPY